MAGTDSSAGGESGPRAAEKPEAGAPAASKPEAASAAKPEGAAGLAPDAAVGYLDRVPSPSFGVHVFLWGNSDTTGRDLRLAKDAGFTFVKQRFEWRNIERDGKGILEWEEPDRIVREVAGAGLGLVARVDNQPKWARKDELFPETGPPSSLDNWADYAGRLAARYKGRIQAYEIWNEPNIDREWGGEEPDAKEYTALLRAAYRAIKRADPDAIVISAGLSPTTNDSAQAKPDGQFLREMYAAGAGEYFDILGVHAAGFKAEPDADPAAVAADRSLTNNDPSAAELRRTYAFRHVEDLRRIMVENGDADKRISIMEMGWTSDSRPGSPYQWHSVSEEEKGRRIVRAFEVADERWQPWIAHMTLIYLSQPDWTQADEQYWWSITNPNGSPRPSYTQIRQALR